MKYKFIKPLSLVTGGAPAVIEEIDIDMESQTLKDMADVENEYYADNKSNNIPPMSRELSVRWMSKVLLILLKKQNPHLLIIDKDVEKIGWQDARQLLLMMVGEYMFSIQDQQIRVLEQFELGLQDKKTATQEEGKENDTIS